MLLIIAIVCLVTLFFIGLGVRFVRPVNYCAIDGLRTIAYWIHLRGYNDVLGHVLKIIMWFEHKSGLWFELDAEEMSAPVEPVVSATEAPEEAVGEKSEEAVVSATVESAPVEPVVSATEAPEENLWADTVLAKEALKNLREGRLANRTFLKFAYDNDIEGFRRLLNDNECEFIGKITEERKLSRAEKQSLKQLLNNK